ncbi:hypothetical protein GCM10027289_20810 [Tsukamurella serpentis]
MDTRDLLERIAAADGGVVSRRAALAHGADPVEIERLRSKGHLRNIRRGWYRLPGADPAVVAAVRSGAVITCVDALAHYGLWTPPRTRTHMRRAQPPVGCRARGLPVPTRAIDPLPQALLCTANCLAADELVAVLDSTLRLRVYTLGALRELFTGPARVTRLLDHLDPQSGSGTESITRFRLQCARIKVRSQVVIPGVGRVDLLVGDKLIIECDSAGHHNNRQRITDNRRDRAAVRGDYRVMRFDYSEIMADWDAIFAEILEIVRSDRHTGRVRPVKPADSWATKPDLAS